MQTEGLWGPVTNELEKMPIDCNFEDSFSPRCNDTPTEASIEEIQILDSGTEDYVPLDDSTQYLAGLERKLARIQGRTANRRQAESRSLIDALVGSRDTHAHELINTSNRTDDVIISTESEIAHQNTAVDPQGALGAVMRRLAPDKVALTQEELCQLLEADFLARIQEAEESQLEEEHADAASSYAILMNGHQSEYSDNPEEKKLSSDEGEK